MSPLLVLAVYLALAVVMAAAWAWQRKTANIGWVDVFWTFGVAAGGIAMVVAMPLVSDLGEGSAPRRLIVCAMVGLWALRLGVYVALRVAGSEEDGRYRAIRQSWGDRLQPRMFGFLQLQALISVALVAAIGLAANRPDPRLGPADLLGVVIGLIAIGGESLADRQMRAFRATAGKGSLCDAGLWAWSRHPNYVFEWLGWFAYPVMAVMLSGGYPQAWWAWAAPLVMFGVVRYGTGVPPLEAHMRKTRGAAFDAYAARVPIFLPRISKSYPEAAR